MIISKNIYTQGRKNQGLLLEYQTKNIYPKIKNKPFEMPCFAFEFFIITKILLKVIP